MVVTNCTQRLAVLWANCTPFGDDSYFYIEETACWVFSKGEVFHEDKALRSSGAW